MTHRNRSFPRGAALVALVVSLVAAPATAQDWSADVLDASAVDRETTGAVAPASDLSEAEGQPQNIPLFQMNGSQDPPPGSMAQHYVFVPNGETVADFPPEVEGRIALVKLVDPVLPSTLFGQVANNAAAAGAVAVLLISETTNPTAIVAPIPAANIRPLDGELLIGLVEGSEGSGDPPNGAISEHPLRINRFFVQSLTVSGTTFAVGTNTFEPTIGADGDGNLFYSVTPGAGVLIGFAAGTFKSEDLGRTWTDVSPTLAGQDYPPETNDPYIYVDQTTGRVFQFHMEPILTCSMMAWTDDAGESWTANPYGCGPTAIWDHQTMVASRPRLSLTVEYPNVLHQCVNSVYAAMCSRSLNGGLSWEPGTPVHENPGPQEDNLCGAQHGHLASAPDGTVYLPTSLCGFRPTVFVSRDDGLTWEQSQVADVNVPLSDPDVAVDRDGNVYVAFIDESGALFMAVSLDEGLTWGEPVLVGEGVTAGLPAVAAGDPGRVVVAFVGTDDLPEGYLTPGYPEGASGEIAWGPYLAVSTNMLDAEPEFLTVDTAAGDPISRGVECVRDDFRCTVQFDFLDVTIAPDGRPYGSFVDGCIDECVTDPNAPLHANPAPAIVATLTEGPLLCEDGCPWKFSTSASFATVVDDADPAVEYRRGWHRRSDPAASDSGYHRRMGSPQGGGGEAPTARLVFEGERITYFFGRSEQGGTADVFLDGELETTVDYSGPAPGSSPEFGHSITFEGLGEGSHEIVIAHRSGTAYVDGFEIVTDQDGGADPLAALTRSITTNTTGELPGLGSTSLMESVEVGPADEWLSVVVEGAEEPVTVKLLDAALAVVAEGDQLLTDSTAVGLDVASLPAGTYTVQVLDTAGSPATVEISIARTIAVE